MVSNTLLEAALNHYDDFKDFDFVVGSSLPILFFGDIEKYKKSKFRVMTAALNPSDMEFKVTKQSDPSKFRFPEYNETPESLKISLSNYFRKVPYERWFGKRGAKSGFLPILNGMGSSYYDEQGKDIAIHTDICSPLATNPKWSDLNKDQKEMLFEKGFVLWKQLVVELQPNLIVMSLKKQYIQDYLNPIPIKVLKRFKSNTNGKRSPITFELILYSIELEGFKTLLLWGSAQHTPLQPFANKFELGQEIFSEIKNCEINFEKNNSFNKSNITNQNKVNVMNKNCNYMEAVANNNPLKSIDELVQKFKTWMNNNPCETIGDVDNFGGAAHIYVRHEGNTYKVNRDTQLAGVRRFVRNYENDNEIILRPTTTTFSVTNNQDGTGIMYFYMYQV